MNASHSAGVKTSTGPLVRRAAHHRVHDAVGVLFEGNLDVPIVPTADVVSAPLGLCQVEFRPDRGLVVIDRRTVSHKAIVLVPVRTRLGEPCSGVR